MKNRTKSTSSIKTILQGINNDLEKLIQMRQKICFLLCFISLFFAINGEAQWQRANGRNAPLGAPTNGITGFTTTNDFIFTGTDSGVYRSNDNGKSWGPVNIGFPAYFSIVGELNNFLYRSVPTDGVKGHIFGIWTSPDFIDS